MFFTEVSKIIVLDRGSKKSPRTNCTIHLHCVYQFKTRNININHNHLDRALGKVQVIGDLKYR